MKAVIPAAGLGLRFLPLTKSQPKEMLPVVDKPAIHYVVEEAVASGIEDILIVTGRGKRAIEDYFDRTLELEYMLKGTPHERLLREVDELSEKVEIHYIRQKEQLGLGHAIYCAQKHVGNEAFAVLLGDTINVSSVPVTRQLMDVYEMKGNSVIAIEPVPKHKIESYGIIKGKRVEPRLYLVEDMVEKPKPKDAPSNLGITGTYVLTPRIFDCIKRTRPGRNREIQLTDSLNLLRREEPVYGYQFEGRRYDIGTKLDWLKVNFELCVGSKEFGAELKEHLKRIT